MLVVCTKKFILSRQGFSLEKTYGYRSDYVALPIYIFLLVIGADKEMCPIMMRLRFFQ